MNDIKNDLQEELTNFGFKNVLKKDKPKLVEQVFSSVALKYDLMNDLMSFGLHRFWKWFSIFTTNVPINANILDIAGGSGDLTIRFKPAVITKNAKIWHTDINEDMLRVGRDKIINNGMIVSHCVCNAECLPFKDNYFDIICVAFGLRNMSDKNLALLEMYRTLKVGGTLLILEFSHIRPFLKPIYDFYSFKILPKLGKFIANDENSYRYLAESIRMHPDCEELKKMIMLNGFKIVEYYSLSFNVVALHKAYKI